MQNPSDVMFRRNEDSVFAVGTAGEYYSPPIFEIWKENHPLNPLTRWLLTDIFRRSTTNQTLSDLGNLLSPNCSMLTPEKEFLKTFKTWDFFEKIDVFQSKKCSFFFKIGKGVKFAVECESIDGFSQNFLLHFFVALCKK